jgi:hypothetical protein
MELSLAMCVCVCVELLRWEPDAEQMVGDC